MHDHLSLLFSYKGQCPLMTHSHTRQPGDPTALAGRFSSWYYTLLTETGKLP